MILSNALISPISHLETQQMMTSQIRSYRIFNTDLIYSCAHFVTKIGEKSCHNSGFLYDLITISHSGLRFWATLYTGCPKK